MYWNSILKPGKYTRGGSGIKYEGTNDLKVVPLSDADVLHFEGASLLIWSEHPAVQHRMADGQWKQRRREAYRRGVRLDEPRPRPEDFQAGTIVIPAPTRLPAGVRPTREVGIQDHTKTGKSAEALCAETEPSYALQPARLPEPAPQPADDGKKAALKARYMQYNYASPRSFAERVGEDPDYVARIGEAWPTEKAARQAAKKAAK